MEKKVRNKKLKFFTIRLPEADYAMIKKIASGKKMPVSSFARELIIKDATKETYSSELSLLFLDIVSLYKELESIDVPSPLLKKLVVIKDRFLELVTK